MPEAGSSPLARGLHAAIAEGSRTWGIIPARAGFTLYAHLTRFPRGDHPRSRGVYPLSAQVTVAGIGSSPLARGLRDDVPESKEATRIIPARAGFTQQYRH